MLVQIFSEKNFPELMDMITAYLPVDPVISNVDEDCLDAINKAHKYSKLGNDALAIAYASVYMNVFIPKLELKPAFNNNSIVYDLLRYIDYHYKENLCLELLAEELHISRFYISKIFSGTLHTSLRTYVNNLRIEYAITLLEQTDYPINRIAYESGFESERTFYRVFGSHMGVTSLQYRKRIHENIGKHK